MPKGLQVHTTGSSVAGAGKVHKFLDDGSAVFGSGSAGAGVDNKSITMFDATNGAGSVSVYGDLSASVNISASAYYGDGSNLSGITSVSVNDSTANTAFPLVFHDGSNGLLDDDGSATYNPSTGLLSAPKLTVDSITIDGTTIDSSGVLTIDTDGTNALNVGTEAAAKTITVGNDASAKVDVNALIIELDSAGSIVLNSVTTTTLDSTQGMSLDAGAASNFTTSGGALTLDGAAGVNIAGNAAEIDVTTSAALDLNSGAGTWNASTLDLTSTAAMTIDSGGVLTIDTDGTDAINLGTEAAAKTITIGNDASTKVDVNALAIELDSAGSIVLNSVTTTTLDATQGISIDAGAASNFTTSGGALTLKGAAGETVGTSGQVTALLGDLTVAEDVRIAGNLDVQGTVTTINSTTVGITGSFSFEGSSSNAHETTLGVVDPTADRTVNIANADGTLIPFAAASTTAISATPEELNVLDGVTAGTAAASKGCLLYTSPSPRDRG